MPGAAWPWKNTWSPDSPWSLPRKKWLKPTSYRLAARGVGRDVAADADSPGRFARETMIAAFHRM